MKQFWKKSLALIAATSIILSNDYIVHATGVDGSDAGEETPVSNPVEENGQENTTGTPDEVTAPDTQSEEGKSQNENPEETGQKEAEELTQDVPAEENTEKEEEHTDPQFVINALLISGETSIGETVTIDPAGYTEQTTVEAIAPEVDGYTFNSAYIIRNENMDTVVSFGTGSYVTDADEEILYTDAANDKNILDAVFSYALNDNDTAIRKDNPDQSETDKTEKEKTHSDSESVKEDEGLLSAELKDRKVTLLGADNTATTYTATLQIYDYDGTTVLSPSDSGLDRAYAYVELTDKATDTIVAWNTIELKPDNNFTAEFTEFKPALDTDNIPWDAPKTYYDSSKHSAALRLYSEEPTYHKVRGELQSWEHRPNDTFEGYLILGQNPSESGSTVSFQKWNSTVLDVKLVAGTEDVSVNDNSYLFIRVDHATTEPTYYFKKLTGSVTIGKGDWLNNNYQPAPNEYLTGKETGISFAIVKNSSKGGGDLQLNQIYSASNNQFDTSKCELVPIGGAVGNYTLTSMRFQDGKLENQE